MPPNVSTRIGCCMQRDDVSSVTYTSIKEPIVASLVEDGGKLTKLYLKILLNMRPHIFVQFLDYLYQC